MQATRLWLIRHGEVEAPYIGRFVGRTDVGLSDLGRHQAQAVASFLADTGVDAILASPRRRAKDTAAALAHASGLDIQVREGLAEMDFGDWEGRAWPDIEAEEPELAARWAEDPGNVPCPGGEAADAFAARAQAAVQGVRDEHPGGTVAIFAHAGVNRAVLAEVLRRPYLEAFAFAQDYGCVNAVAWPDGGRPQIALANFVPGPRSQDNGDRL